LKFLRNGEDENDGAVKMLKRKPMTFKMKQAIRGSAIATHAAQKRFKYTAELDYAQILCD
jgi:hypothetical protein